MLKYFIKRLSIDDEFQDVFTILSLNRHRLVSSICAVVTEKYISEIVGFVL